MNLQDEIKEIEEFANYPFSREEIGYFRNKDYSQDVAIKAMSVINKQRKIIETAIEAMKESVNTANNLYPNSSDALKYSIQLISGALDKIKSISEE